MTLVTRPYLGYVAAFKVSIIQSFLFTEKVQQNMDSAPVSSPQTFTASSCMRGQVPQGTRLRKWRCGSEMALQLALVFPLMSSRALQTWKPLLVSEFVCVGAKFQQSHGNFHSFWLIPTNSYQFRLICRNTPMHFHKIQLVCRPISLDLFKVQQSR